MARSVSATGLLVAFVVLLLASPGSVGVTSTTVTINDASLAPAAISIAIGGSVVWHNATSVGQVVTIEHSVVLPEIAPGGTSAPWKPSSAGPYSYIAQRAVAPRTSLHGTVTVVGPTASPKPSPTATPKSSPTAAPKPSPSGASSHGPSPSVGLSPGTSPSPSESGSPGPSGSDESAGPTSSGVGLPPAPSGSDAPWGALVVLLLGIAVGAGGYRWFVVSRRRKIPRTSDGDPEASDATLRARSGRGPRT